MSSSGAAGVWSMALPGTPSRTSAVVFTPYLTLLRSPSALQLSDW